MDNYILNSITMKNFKLFGPHGYTITFADDKLIVFDGPNGYGKTTVFDAIELALTGNISRFHPIETNSSPKDIVVAHNNSKDVEIKLELKGPQNLTIIRRLKKTLPKGSTKIKNFKDLWELFKLNNEGESLITETQLRELLCVTTLERDFHLFHYVQQEETAHFLKSKDEKGRAEAITELFGDTKKEEQNLDRLGDLNKKISALLKKYEFEKIEIEKAFGLSNLKADESASSVSSYRCLFPWLKENGIAPEWDLEDIPNLTPQKRGQVIGDLTKIKSLIAHGNLFLAERQYVRIANEKDVIRALLLCSKYIDKSQILKELAINKAFLETALGKLDAVNVGDIESNVDLAKIFQLVSYANGKEFKKTLHDLNLAIVQNRGNNQLYTELIQYRDETNKKYQEIDGRRTDCPMCGNSFETSELLLKAIAEQGTFYKSLLDDDGSRVLALKNGFEKDHLAPLTAQIKTTINGLNAPEPKLLAEINKAAVQQERVAKFKTWLNDQHIEYTDLCLEYHPVLISEVEFEHKLQIFMERLKAKAPSLSSDYLQSKEESSFDSFFVTYFQSSQTNLSFMNNTDIDSKIRYVQSKYYNSVDQQVKEIELLNRKIEDLKGKQESIKVIRDIIQSEIRSYQKKLITDIEIPFFLYSGKILQTHQAGLGRGVFIKDPVEGDELKNIRFVSNWDSEHDILNTMSSGQIAAVVISLTLALNRVYSNGFDTILVDDPVQTMDDINMISLVELLRNEFPSKQVILATHEESVSRYFLYKYLKHGHTVRKINLMERTEHRLMA